MQARRRTGPEVRRAIQESGEGIRTLAARYGLDPKTVRRWRNRSSLADRKPGPQTPRSTALGLHEEATIVVIRRLTLLPLDDCFHALRALIPGLTRASLHRCLRRHGVSRLPAPRCDGARPGEFDLHLFAYGEGAQRLCMFIAVERASRYVFAELYATSGPPPVGDFLRALTHAVPVQVRTVFTERRGPLAPLRAAVAEGCAGIGAAHKGVEPGWTADQIARAREVILEAGRQRAANFDLDQMRSRLAQFAGRFNGLCRLKALGGLTPQACLAQSFSSARSAPEEEDGAQAQAQGRRRPRRGHGDRLRDPESTREAILQAARGLLARVGPAGMSITQVARIAGVNRGTAYQHFRSRQQLAKATAEWSAEQLHEVIFGKFNRWFEGDGGENEIAAVAERLANFAMENPEMCQAWLFQFLTSPNPSKDPFWREWCGAATQFHATEAAKDDIDTEVFSIIQLAGAFLWPTWARAQAGEGADLAPYARRFAHEFLRSAVYGVIRPEYFPDLVARLRADPTAPA